MYGFSHWLLLHTDARLRLLRVCSWLGSASLLGATTAIRLPAERLLGCVPVLTVRNKLVINIHV